MRGPGRGAGRGRTPPVARRRSAARSDTAAAPFSALGPGAAGRGAGVMPSNARVTGSQAQPSPDPAQLRPPPPRNQAPASLCQAARTRPRPPSVTGLSSYNVIGVFDTLRHPRGRDTLQVSCIENIFGWWAGYQNVFVAWRCVTVRRRRLREAPHRAAARRGGDT